MGMIMKKLNLFAGIAVALSGLFASQTFAASGCISSALLRILIITVRKSLLRLLSAIQLPPQLILLQFPPRIAIRVASPPLAPRPLHAIRLPPLPATLAAIPAACPPLLAAEPAPLAEASAATDFADVNAAAKAPCANSKNPSKAFAGLAT